MANDATIIAGSLDSKELEKSINELINMVDSKLNGDGGMASKFQDGINKMQASLNSLSSTFRGMKGDVKDFASSFDGMAKARQQAINGSKSGGSDRITFDSDVEKGLTYVVNANKDIDSQLEAIIIKEQQMLATKNEETRATEAAAAAQQNLTNVASGTARIYENVYEQQMRANQTIRESSSNVSTTFRDYDNLRSAVASVLGVEREHIQVIGSEHEQYTVLASRLKMLQAIYNNLNASDRTSERGQELVKSMQQIERAMQKIRVQAARPVSLADAMSISEKTLDDMAYKMRMLSAYRGGLDTTEQKNEIDRVNKSYNELKKKMDDIMQKNQSMMSSNNALARSWNYMKNRLAFYLTIGASTQFIKNLIEVRSQYEMNERALGILVDSAERGTQIFNELSQMSLVSPYTLIELSAAAKQLVAYDVAAKDVVDTTRRLADMASAVGVPIERLTYALGQIKAYGYLNSRDNRMFANAGIPLVKQLAEYYTELEGKLVSTSDVYDRIKKKAVSYNDVMQVVNKMTDEGGKFFDFQAKMAETLKVRLANLTLAWNNMLNAIGKDYQGFILGAISGITKLLKCWREFDKALKAMAWTFGIVKAFQIAHIKRTEKMSLANAALAASGTKVTQYLLSFKNNVTKLMSSPLTWWSSLVFLVVSLTQAFVNARAAIRKLNSDIREGANENFNSIQKFLDASAELRQSFYKNERAKSDSKVMSDGEAKKTWDSLREQIELTSESSDYFIGRLLKINDINDRVREGFSYLEKLRDVMGALQDIDSNTIKVQQDWSKWWNLNTGLDSLYENVQQINSGLSYAVEQLGGYQNVMEKISSIKNGTPISGEDLLTLSKYLDNLDILETNLTETSNSIATFLSGKNLDAEGWRLAYEQITRKIIEDGNLSTEEQFRYRLEQERNFIKIRHEEFKKDREWIKNNEQGLTDEEVSESLKRSRANEEAWFKSFGESRVLAEGFYSWLKSQHRHEIDNMFGHLSEEELKTIDNSVPKWREWAYKNAKEFSERWKVSFDDLWKQINDTNKMEIFIRGSVVFGDNKTEYDILTEADQAADDAWKKMERLAKRRDELLKKGFRGAGNTAEDKEYNKTLSEITIAQQDYNKALAEGGHSKKQDTKNTKDQKNAETELQKALKNELSLIDKVRGVYKDLRKEGASMQDALSFATSGYDEAVAEINKVFAKFSLTPLDLSKYAGVSNPRALLDMIQHQLDELEASGRVKPAEIQALQFKIKDLKVDAEKYDLTKITKGLNSELDKLKDEYELAVELDANPELGDMFSNMLGIDTEGFPKTIDEYMRQVQGAFDELANENNYVIPLDVFKASEEDWKNWAETVGMSEEALKDFNAKFLNARELAKGWAREVVGQTKDLEYKLADTAGKIDIESKKLHDLEAQRENETNAIRRHYLDLAIQDQERAISELKAQALSLLPEYDKVFGAAAEHSARVARRLQTDLKNVYDNAVFDTAKKEYKITGKDGTTVILDEERYTRERNKLNKELQKSADIFERIKVAFSGGEDGEKDFAMGLDLIAQEAQKVAEGIRTVGEIVGYLGGEAAEGAVETINDIATSIDGMATAAQGIAQIQSGDLIGGTVNVIKGTWNAISTWFDNSDKKITRQIKESERNVNKLERAYSQLEWQVSKALGVEETKTRRAAIATKEAMLAELERQLVLEQSRKAKKRDEDTINDLQSQIESSRREIADLKEELINNLLGSDVKSAAEEFVDTWVEAWRAGETTLDAIQAKMDDITMNLIKKAVTSRIVEGFLSNLYSQVNEFSKAGSAGGEDFTNEELKALAVLSQELGVKINDALGAFYGNLESLGVVSKTINDGEKGLSALQAGIKGITEEQAGALEAYWNANTQQQYVHTDLLTQIRDTIIGFDMDIQVGTLSQMLLQLQQSYAVQLAIRNMLAGWSNPSGMAVRVEMI